MSQITKDQLDFRPRLQEETGKALDQIMKDYELENMDATVRYLIHCLNTRRKKHYLE